MASSSSTTTNAVISVGRLPQSRASGPATFTLPDRPQDQLRAWVPAGGSVRIAGLDVPGMVYFGRLNKDKPQEGEPSLIDPNLPVAAVGAFKRVGGAVWVTYATLQPSDRRGYLEWLASGREHPAVDERLIFLFMFGLERRATVDARTNPAAEADLPAIQAELHRLSTVYSDSPNVVNAANSLLYWIQHPEPPPKLYSQRDSALHRAFGLKAYTLLAVGQSAADGVPLSASLARTWMVQRGLTYYRDLHRTFRTQFEGLFDDLYGAVYGAGIVLPMTRRSVKLTYRPFNPALAARHEISRDIGPVADVEELRDEAQQIKAVFEAATKEIERYEALVRRRSHSLGSLEVLTQLPVRLWPVESRRALRDLVERSQTGELVMEAQELIRAIDGMAEPTKSSFSLATKLVGSMGLQIEPPLITATGRAVKPNALSMLFPTQALADEPADDLINTIASEFVMAAAMLAVREDSDIRPLDWLGAQMANQPSQEIRTSWKLRARIAGLATKLPTEAEARKAASSVPQDRLEAVAGMLCEAAVSAGEPTAVQVKLLERLYPALTLDRKRVASDLHAAAAGGRRQVANGFALDASLIAQLQHDTHKVGQMLASIFAEEQDQHSQEETPKLPGPAEQEAARSSTCSGLLGLDPEHSTLATEMLAKPIWQREELASIAQRLGLMLDGALERINEAAFDAHNTPFTEGDDPVELNPEILEILQ